MGRLFFTSDTHFGHGGSLGLFKRPFGSVAEMTEALVANWNATVAPADTVWHLGDVAIGPKREAVAEILARLNGTKHLVTGNNDGPAAIDQPAWASVQAYAELEAEGRKLVLCHYPFRSWNGQGKGALNLHGHSHGRLEPLTRQVDVGVDAWDFRPVAVDEVLDRATRRRRA